MSTVSPPPLTAVYRAEVILRDSGDPAGLEVAEGLRAALDGKVRVGAALGFERRGGAGGVARVVALARRDSLLRDLYRRFHVATPPRQAARHILALAAHRSRATRPAVDDAGRLMDAALAFGDLPGEPQIARILDIQDPLWMS